MRRSKYLFLGLAAAVLLAIATAFALPHVVTLAEGNEITKVNVTVTGDGIIDGNAYYLLWENLSFTFNGNEQKPSVVLKCEEDTAFTKAATITVENEAGQTSTPVNVGNYVAVAQIVGVTFTDAENKKEFTISPLSKPVQWNKDANYTYSGNAQGPKASYQDVDGASHTLTASGYGTDAGAYTASVTATSAGGNYTLTNLTCGYTISPKSIAVQWNKAANYTYSGNAQGPTASYTDVNGVNHTLTASGCGTDAGSHTASVTATAAGDNYLLTGNLTCEYVIDKFVGEVLWVVSDYYIENGNSQGPRAFVVAVSGGILELPVKGFGEKAGDFTAEIDLSNVDSNFDLTGDLSCSYKILPEKQFGTVGTALSVIFGVLLLGCGVVIGFLIFLRKKDATKKQDESNDENSELRQMLEEEKSSSIKKDNEIYRLNVENRSIKKIKDKLYKELQDAKATLVAFNEEIDELKKKLETNSADKKRLEALEDKVKSLTELVQSLSEENERLKSQKTKGPDFYKHPIEEYFPKIDAAYERAESCDYDSENPRGSFYSQRQELDEIMKLIAIYRSQRR